MDEMFTLIANFHRLKMSPTCNFPMQSIRAKVKSARQPNATSKT